MIKVRPTLNKDEIKTIIFNDAIWPNIADPETKKEYFDFNFKDDFFVGGYVDGKIIALMVYHDFRDGLKCHIQVLPQFRDLFAVEFGNRSLTFRDKSKMLYCEIDDKFKNVIKFAKSFGFKDFEKNGSSNIMRLSDGIC